jgi:hypothetical protein
MLSIEGVKFPLYICNVAIRVDLRFCQRSATVQLYLDSVCSLKNFQDTYSPSMDTAKWNS